MFRKRWDIAGENYYTNEKKYRRHLSFLPKSFKGNPEFLNTVHDEIMKSFNNEGETRVYMGLNHIYLIGAATKEYVKDVPIVSQTLLDAVALKDGKLEVIKTTGKLFTDENYHKPIKLENSDLIVDLKCERHVFDKYGIEQATSIYDKEGIRVFNNPTSSLDGILTMVLIDEGVSVPKKWNDDDGPTVPKNSKGAKVSGSRRLSGVYDFDGFCGVQKNYSYEVGDFTDKKTPQTFDYTESLSRVSKDYPNRLVLDKDMIFAIADDNKEMKPKDEYKEFSLDSLCAYFSHNAFVDLDKSNIKFGYPIQYNALKYRMSEENEIYKNSDYQESEKIEKPKNR